MTSRLTAIKNHVIKYYETVYVRNGKNLFWSINHPGEMLNKIKSKGILASSLSTYDFSALYTTLSQNLIKNLTELFDKLLTERVHFIWLVMRNASFLL